VNLSADGSVLPADAAGPGSAATVDLTSDDLTVDSTDEYESEDDEPETPLSVETGNTAIIELLNSKKGKDSPSGDLVAGAAAAAKAAVATAAGTLKATGPAVAVDLTVGLTVDSTADSTAEAADEENGEFDC
jgi:hypothetical protein